MNRTSNWNFVIAWNFSQLLSGSSLCCGILPQAWLIFSISQKKIEKINKLSQKRQIFWPRSDHPTPRWGPATFKGRKMPSARLMSSSKSVSFAKEKIRREGQQIWWTISSVLSKLTKIAKGHLFVCSVMIMYVKIVKPFQPFWSLNSVKIHQHFMSGLRVKRRWLK
jgi:hypothetical protein